MRYLSDCHLATVINVDGEKGICTQCKKGCWACDPEMLKPVSLDRIKNCAEAQCEKPVELPVSKGAMKQEYSLKVVSINKDKVK